MNGIFLLILIRPASIPVNEFTLINIYTLIQLNTVNIFMFIYKVIYVCVQIFSNFLSQQKCIY